MLSVSWDTIRLFLHVLAATIWVGGQITLAALVPVLRRCCPRHGPSIPAPRHDHYLISGLRRHAGSGVVSLLATIWGTGRQEPW
jgi:putative copper export protein